MTRKSTWTNSDGLVVGFGANFPERQEGGVVKSFGSVQEAVLNITYESTLGEAGASIRLPKNAVVLEATLEVTTAWASADSGTLAVGHDEADTADTDAFFLPATLTAAALTPAGKTFYGDGVYFKDTNAQKLPVAITDSFDDATKGAVVFFTKANNFTAGAAKLVLRYLA
jgi:hypothetical protein